MPEKTKKKKAEQKAAADKARQEADRKADEAIQKQEKAVERLETVKIGDDAGPVDESKKRLVRYSPELKDEDMLKSTLLMLSKQ